MKFRTEIDAKRSHLTLTPELPLVLAGSCFADNMARMMRGCLWDAVTPLGVLFNPLSIARCLHTCLINCNPEAAFRESLFESRGIVMSWLSDSSGNALSEEEAVGKFMLRRQGLIEALTQGATICVTFGTAYGYFLSSNPGIIVANCHKQPAREFQRRRISISEIVSCWSEIIVNLRESFKDLRIIFTVSPVRHVRDGLHENTLSKSILHLAVDELCSQFAGCEYFPAYELLIDDLRDYRFYADDMAHPSSLATEYIWKKFVDTFIDDNGKDFLHEGEELNRRLSHRHIIPDSPEARSFDQKTAELLASFRLRYPRSLNPANPNPF